MLVGVAPLPLSFPASGTEAFCKQAKLRKDMQHSVLQNKKTSMITIKLELKSTQHLS